MKKQKNIKITNFTHIYTEHSILRNHPHGMIAANFVLALVGTAFVAVTAGAFLLAAYMAIIGKNRAGILNALADWAMPLYVVFLATSNMLTSIALIVTRYVVRLAEYPVYAICVLVPLVLYTTAYIAGDNSDFLQVASAISDVWFEIWLHTLDLALWIVRFVFEAVVPFLFIFSFLVFIS